MWVAQQAALQWRDLSIIPRVFFCTANAFMKLPTHTKNQNQNLELHSMSNKLQAEHEKSQTFWFYHNCSSRLPDFKLCGFLHNLKGTEPLETQGTEVCVQHHLLWEVLLTVVSVMQIRPL